MLFPKLASGPDRLFQSSPPRFNALILTYIGRIPANFQKNSV